MVTVFLILCSVFINDKSEDNILSERRWLIICGLSLQIHMDGQCHLHFSIIWIQAEVLHIVPAHMPRSDKL